MIVKIRFTTDGEQHSSCSLSSGMPLRTNIYEFFSPRTLSIMSVQYHRVPNSPVSLFVSLVPSTWTWTFTMPTEGGRSSYPHTASFYYLHHFHKVQSAIQIVASWGRAQLLELKYLWMHVNAVHTLEHRIIRCSHAKKKQQPAHGRFLFAFCFT